MRNLIRALRGKLVELSPKQEEKMARMRAKAYGQIAAAEARGSEAQAEAARFAASRGAAQGGASFSAPGAAGAPAQAPPGQMPSVRDMLKQSFEGFRDAVGEMFDDRSGIIDPGEGADLNRPPTELTVPAERAEGAASSSSCAPAGSPRDRSWSSASTACRIALTTAATPRAGRSWNGRSRTRPARSPRRATRCSRPPSGATHTGSPGARESRP